MSILADTDHAADDRLLLDLLNSTPTEDAVRRDELEESSDARAWLRAHDGRGTLRELQRLRETRAVLQGVVRGQASPAALSPLIGKVSYRPVATDEGLSW